MGSNHILQLHKQYLHQAIWTEDIRKRFYDQLSFPDRFRALEVGSGTGVISSELSHETGTPAIGLDIDPSVTAHAVSWDTISRYLVGDGARLPFPNDFFDLVVCHFLLLWTRSPERILEDMMRVTRPGGAIAAFAEPDYDARIDYPETLEILGVMQSQSLQRRGADTFMGRRLRELFSFAGLTDVVSGLLGGEWRESSSTGDFRAEWETLYADLKAEIGDEELAEYRERDWEAIRHHRRILFVPTFYAFGRVAVI